MDEHIYPNERAFREHVGGADRWQPAPVVEELKARARAEGLWNLFLPGSEYGAGLTNLEYAPMAEPMGRSPDFTSVSCSPTGRTPPRRRRATRSAA